MSRDRPRPRSGRTLRRIGFRPARSAWIPGRLLWTLCAVAAFCNLAAYTRAQTTQERAETELDRLVEAGLVDEVASRVRGSTRPEDLRALARAQANRAARSKPPELRQREFELAEIRFEAWIAATKTQRDASDERRALDEALARIELGNLYFGKWAAPALDEFELLAGRTVDLAALARLLDRARDQFEKAYALVDPLLRALETGGPDMEDRFLAAGIYDALRQLDVDVDYNRAWAALTAARVRPASDERRATILRDAEKHFSRLVALAPSGKLAYRVHLGMGLTLREQGRPDEARRHMQRALELAENFASRAQVRFEQARNELAAGEFNMARERLGPLLELADGELTPEQQAGRFYVNLARLWDALCDLERSSATLKSAAGSASRGQLEQRARREREAGLLKLNRLAGRGGPWPRVVKVYVEDVIKPTADPKSLTPIELVFTARHLLEAQQPLPAIERLEEAAGRGEVGQDLLGEILMELGTAHFRRDDLRSAARVFDRVCTELKSHQRAPEAATFAYQLWAKIAEDGQQPEDYARLADTLLNLVRSFPEHPKRGEALWWLPVALQSAGKHVEAAEQFAKVPRESPRWEEAQYRRVICLRQALERERASLDAAQYVQRARSVASDLRRYADLAFSRSGRGKEGQALRGWSAQATVVAAELLVDDGVLRFQEALDLLSEFESRYGQSDVISRVLAVRIRALRGLQRVSEAAEVVQQYLKTVSPEKAGGVLAMVARSAQQEVDRLLQAGQEQEAARVAADSIATFEQLENALAAGKPADLDAVRFGSARMKMLAGRYEEARSIVEQLLQKEPRSGHYQRLLAQIATRALPPNAGVEALRQARETWSVLLRDATLRERSAELYWEARYEFLSLLLREGAACDVEAAIRQERIWQPDLGGGHWRPRLEKLHDQAASLCPTATRPAEEARREQSK